ncbi:MAG: endonuclease/exonuclease/phosphatase family protein [Acidobacteriota bacterium]
MFSIAEGAETTRQRDGPWKLAAFNIAHGRGGVFGASNWQDRDEVDLERHLDAIAQQIASSAADVVVLNEADFDTQWSHRVDQARVIAEKAGYPFVAAQPNIDVSVPFVSFSFGNAILSRFPLREARAFDFSPWSPLQDLLAGNHDGLFAVVELPDGPVAVLAVHLEVRSEAVRVECAKQILALRDETELPLLVAGDFNSTPLGFPGAQRTVDGLNALSLLVGGGFSSAIRESGDASAHFSFPSAQPEIVIDWVLASEGVTLVESRVVQSTLSDHLMVVASVVVDQPNG